VPEKPTNFVGDFTNFVGDSKFWSDNEEVQQYRLRYQAFRRGEAKGAKKEIYDAAKRESTSELENRLLKIFQPSSTSLTVVNEMVDRVSRDFIETNIFCTANVSEGEIAERFKEPNIREDPEDISDYMETLVRDVVTDSIHTSAPQMIGHMTSALPGYMMPLSKLLVAMNQNVVKTETAKTVTFLEREALAKLHRVIFNFDEKFYSEHIQNPKGMLGIFTSGGTLANTSALWIARNQKLGASADGRFKGVEREGLVRALRYHGYDDMIIIGSALMHYSLDKAADLLGVGVQGLVKIPVDTNYQVDLAMMEQKILQAIENKTLIAAVIGICGTTETGAIDDLQGMACLAAKYGLHFHVDAAWGGPCIFSSLHRHKAKGIALADSVTLDGHKQLWLPMGCGMVFLKDPYAVNAVSKTANYIIRKDSYDLGKFTIDGSRGAQAIYLHANLEVLGLRGYEVLFDRTVRIARYMARCILRSTNFELLVKPMSNILLYRWIPAPLRQMAWEATLTDEENETINEANRKLQDLQKQRGKTFVSRTTINAPKYNQKPIVGLRVVIGNPLTTEADIDAVFWDQDAIILSHFSNWVTSSPEAIVDRDFGVQYADATKADPWQITNYYDAVWAAMTPGQRFIFSNDIDSLYDAMITPDCFLEPSKHFLGRALKALYDN
jgi:glutamate decarboxylase